jgi:hypothetical protein
MKRFLWILVMGLVLISGCTEIREAYRQDISNSFDKMDCDGLSKSWYTYATEPAISVERVAQCYEREKVYRLCLEWDTIYERYIEYPEDVTKLRSAISEALIEKNEDPLKCRNPNQDASFKSKYEIKKANARAAAAQAAAAAAQQEAEQAEIRAQQEFNKTQRCRWRPDSPGC